jgi:hypothetical protein
MAKKRNLKKEKAERNREYARQFQKSRSRNAQRHRRNSSDDDNMGDPGSEDEN